MSVPPCATAMDRAIARPSPSPKLPLAVLVVKCASKIFGKVSACAVPLGTATLGAAFAAED